MIACLNMPDPDMVEQNLIFKTVWTARNIVYSQNEKYFSCLMHVLSTCLRLCLRFSISLCQLTHLCISLKLILFNSEYGMFCHNWSIHAINKNNYYYSKLYRSILTNFALFADTMTSPYFFIILVLMSV